MQWRGRRRSDNVVRAKSGGGRRGGGLPVLGGMSITGVLVAMGIAWLFGINPVQFLSLMEGGGSATQTTEAISSAQQDEQTEFVQVIMASTEDVWQALFREQGQTYREPRLVLYTGSVGTACGTGSSAMGPFYCPGDQHAYLDLGFFQEMTTRFRAEGDLARAYVIAHEVGHHVQNLQGVLERTAAARQRGQRTEGADGLSVRQELQADCYAGVWAHHAQRQYQWLEPGDLESALNAASAIGDDALQKQARGHAVPDSFTHGTSAQRQRWFRTGFESGNMNSCNTFEAARL